MKIIFHSVESKGVKVKLTADRPLAARVKDTFNFKTDWLVQKFTIFLEPPSFNMDCSKMEEVSFGKDDAVEGYDTTSTTSVNSYFIRA